MFKNEKSKRVLKSSLIVFFIVFVGLWVYDVVAKPTVTVLVVVYQALDVTDKNMTVLYTNRTIISKELQEVSITNPIDHVYFAYLRLKAIMNVMWIHKGEF